MRKLKRNIFTIVGVLLVLGGLLVFVDEWRQSRNHATDTDKGIEEQWGKIEAPVDGETKKDDHKSDNVEIAKPNQSRTAITDEMIGVIRADAIKLKEPIYMGASELNMRRGVATVEADEHLGEHMVAIAGHRSPTRYKYFSEVLRLKKGNEIVIETKDAEGSKVETVYVVERSYPVEITNRSVLEADMQKPRKLILITCDEWNSKTKTYDKRWITEAYIK